MDEAAAPKKASRVAWAARWGFWIVEIFWGLLCAVSMLAMLVLMIAGDWKSLSAIFGIEGIVYDSMWFLVIWFLGVVILGLPFLVGVILSFYALWNCRRLDRAMQKNVKIWSGGALSVSGF